MAPTTSAAEAAVLIAPLAAPSAVGVVAALTGRRRGVGAATLAAAVTVLAAGAAAAVRTADGTVLAVAGLRADALSSLMLLIIGSVAVIATWSGIDYLDAEVAAGRTGPRGARAYAALLPWFLAAMVLTVLAANLGVMWAAIEATTVAAAFLVGHRRGRGPLEAAWKYVVICSVGVALAYLGTVLVYFASRRASGDGHGSLDWATLAAEGGSLDPGVLQLAFVLIVLGFGTKAGLAPMHGWLPDAHSQAPAPVSALMSGALLSLAVYALMRYRVIAAAALDPAFVRGILLAVALASLAVAASLLLAQQDYKRLLAYSSIEHMGIAVLGVAVGSTLAIAAVLLHLLGHGIAKAVLFCGSGRLLALEGTTRLDAVRGLLARRPLLAGITALGLAGLLGLPPFSLFASELALVRATAAGGAGWVLVPALALVCVAFVAVVSRTSGMLLSPRAGEPAAPAPAAARPGTAPLVAGLAVLAVLGTVTWPLAELLDTAGSIVGTAS